MSKVGVIGYGHQVKRLLGMMQEMDSSCHISAIADVRHHEIREQMNADGVDLSRISFYENADDMLGGSELDGVFIGTRCSLHTSMALKVLPRQIPLYLEKPVATTMEDLVKLRNANALYGNKTVVSFPLRVTHHVQLVKEIIESGKIGTVEHVQAINNVNYGNIYYHGWFRDEAETQGLFVQKATHDFDYINHILGLRPVTVCAMTSKQIFKGNKPAGLQCKNCDETSTCPESPDNLRKHAFEEPLGPYCCFAEDTGNEDSGSALIAYESGMHMSYSQNFFVRKKAAARGARFLGYKGTVEFDWATNRIQVFMHHTPRVESYEIDSAATAVGHAGGDSTLLENFIALMQGRTQTSVSTLEDGLNSTLLCLKAKESAETGSFCEVKWPD